MNKLYCSKIISSVIYPVKILLTKILNTIFVRDIIVNLFFLFFNKNSKKKINDRYVDYFDFLIGGKLYKGNRELISYVFSNIKNHSNILQIGCFTGKTTVIMSHFAKKNNIICNFIDCDHFKFTQFEKIWFEKNKFSISSHDYDKFIFENYKKNINFFKIKVQTFKSDSIKFLENIYQNREIFDIDKKKLNIKKFDFVFVDGWHSYEHTKKEFYFIEKLLNENSYILFDDSYMLSGWGVDRLMKEINKKNNFKLISRMPNYLFQKVSV